MKTITLLGLKKRRLDPETVEMLENTWELDDWNKSVYRHRMENGDIDHQIFMMTHDGNDPKPIKQMLNEARCYYEAHVYTDAEWEQYFIPAINKMINYHNSFVRWRPGYVIKHKQTDECCIVEYDYARKFGGHDYESLAVVDIDANGNPYDHGAWADYNNYELVDDKHVKENIAKIRAYYKSIND